MDFKALPTWLRLVVLVCLAISAIYLVSELVSGVRKLMNSGESSVEESVIIINKEFYLYTPNTSLRATGSIEKSSFLRPKAFALTIGEPLDTTMIDHTTKKLHEQQAANDTESADKISRQSYCIGNMDFRQSFNWLCYGNFVVYVPVDLDPTPTSLRLLNTGIHSLTRRSLINYKETLRDFTLEDSRELKIIEPGTFANLTKLRLVYIIRAPQLVSLDSALTGFLPNLTTVRIQQTGLSSWPNISIFSKNLILTSIDLDNNKITSLGQEPIRIRTESLNLEFNLITSIEEFTFSESEIGILSLAGNRLLTSIHKNAFALLANLMKLNLSNTGIMLLPTAGLDQLRTLIMMNTHSLKQIPSLYEFPMLEIAHLTYSHHCCSFRYPQTHDPSGYEEHLRFQEEINELCESRRLAIVNGQLSNQEQQLTTSTGSEFEGFFEGDKSTGVSANSNSTSSSPSPSTLTASTSTVTSTTSEAQTLTSLPIINENQIQVSSVELLSSLIHTENTTRMFKKLLMHNIECGELAFITQHEVSCTPEPDAFNPCEDIMGYTVLRVAVWFVVGAAVFGNLSVILVLGGVFRRLSVPKFLQLNLAIGDLFMGVYLAMLAAADLTTGGSYFNYAIDWQYGFGCKIAGAISLFASQLSIFTLSVITFERYYTITYSIDLNMRLQLGRAARIMFIGWCYAFSCAILPIFADVNSYNKTSICLPMRIDSLQDRLFLTIILVLDTNAFLIIFACYLKMYLLIIRQKTEASAKERTVAMRMALLVFTDFACWAPIIFYGATAIYGLPLISMTNSKILIVFFYPLNSMANPFLYVISTRQYRRDLNYLTSRWHVWRKNLFKRNNESYYSNSGQLNMVHHHNLAGQLPIALQSSLQLPCRERQRLKNGVSNRIQNPRIVCSKLQSNYTVRHQIITIHNKQESGAHQIVSEEQTPDTLSCSTVSKFVHPSDLRRSISTVQQQKLRQRRHSEVQVADGFELESTTDLTNEIHGVASAATQAHQVCRNCYPCCPDSANQHPDSEFKRRRPSKPASSSSRHNSMPKVEVAPNTVANSMISVTQLTSLPTTTADSLTNLQKTETKCASRMEGQAEVKNRRRCSCLAVDDIFKESIPTCQLFPSQECLTHHQKKNNNNNTNNDAPPAHHSPTQVEQADQAEQQSSQVDILGNLSNNEATTSSFSTSSQANANQPDCQAPARSSSGVASPPLLVSIKNKCRPCHNHSHDQHQHQLRHHRHHHHCHHHHQHHQNRTRCHHNQRHHELKTCNQLSWKHLLNKQPAHSNQIKRSLSAQDVSRSSSSLSNQILKYQAVERCKHKRHHHHQQHHRQQQASDKTRLQYCKLHRKQIPLNSLIPYFEKEDLSHLQRMESAQKKTLKETPSRLESILKSPNTKEETTREMNQKQKTGQQVTYYSLEQCFQPDTSKDYLIFKREKKRVSIATLH